MSRSTTALLVAVVLAAGASVATSIPEGAGASTTTRKPKGQITVSAAASLTEAFTTIRARFEKRNPDVSVSLNFGSSSTLATQIAAGAPADVYASADRTTMARLVAGGHVTATPIRFARNRMEIAVKPGNPSQVANLADLARIGVVSLCGPAVPCGVYAEKALQKAGVTIPESRVTRGADARVTLAAVAHGDANAAIVYTTDVTAAGTSIDGVAIPVRENVIAVYPIAPLATSKNVGLARAFIDFVVSPAGRRVLAGYGFLGP